MLLPQLHSTFGFKHPPAAADEENAVLAFNQRRKQIMLLRQSLHGGGFKKAQKEANCNRASSVEENDYTNSSSGYQLYSSADRSKDLGF
jgi:hypothetical protein